MIHEIVQNVKMYTVVRLAIRISGCRCIKIGRIPE